MNAKKVKPTNESVAKNQERILTLLQDISKQISDVADQVKDISKTESKEILLDKPKD